MDQDNMRGLRPFIHNPQTVSHPAPTPTADVASPADIDRDTYTLTVDGVAALLNERGVDRDKRTLQRWCKSGKLRAVVDAANGDRYLIDPVSVEELVPGLVAEDAAKPKRHAATSHDMPGHDARHDATPKFTSRHAVMQEENRQAYQAVNDEFDDATDRDGAATSHDVDPNVAALEERVAELEREKRTLEIDKRVREEYNGYLEKQFSKLLENHDTTTLELGRAQQEVQHLKAMLPPGAGHTSSIPFEEVRDAEPQDSSFLGS